MCQLVDLQITAGVPVVLPIDQDAAVERLLGDLDTFCEVYKGEGCVDVARFWTSTAFTGDQIAHLFRQRLDQYSGAEVGKVALAIGRCLRDCGHYHQSLPFLEKALEIYIEEYGAESPPAAEAYSELGRTHFRLNSFGTTHIYWYSALRIRRELAPDEGNHKLAVAINNFALVAGKTGNFEAAERAYEECIAMYKRVLGPVHVDLATAMHNFALLKSEIGVQLLEATELYRQALAMKIKLFGPRHLELAMTYNNLGLVKAKRCLHYSAIVDYHLAKEIFEEVHGPLHPNVAMVCFNMGVCYGKLDRPMKKEAEFYLQLAFKIRADVFGEASEQALSVVAWLDYWKLDVIAR